MVIYRINSSCEAAAWTRPCYNLVFAHCVSSLTGLFINRFKNLTHNERSKQKTTT
jgi:hypothetical protein